MRKLLAALAATALAASPLAAQNNNAAMATVTQFVAAFNVGDSVQAVATCAAETVIIDEFAPYEWHGKGACMAWMKAYAADAEQQGISDGIVTLGTPKHIDMSGDHAYIVVPADYTFKKKGTPVKETGSILTVALQKEKGGWKMTGWAWAKN